jgi:hypothetical protein
LKNRLTQWTNFIIVGVILGKRIRTFC